MRIAVVGAGSWGTTVAALCAPRHETSLWARRRDVSDAINRSHRNPDYLGDRPLPAELVASTDLSWCVEGADVIAFAVPSHGMRAVASEVAPAVPASTPLLSLTKGIEQDTLMRMTEVIADVMGDHDTRKTGVLTGPNLAGEIADGQPAAAVIAMADERVGALLQSAFMTPTFRIYTNTDVIGCETAGALKNVMAIAAGMAKGMGFGTNTVAALITRALAELSRLGQALGGRPLTFAGLAGMGDLVATCVSDGSRNNQVGMRLARGEDLETIVTDMRMVAEGVKTTKAVLALAESTGVDMPIATHVGAVLYEGADPREAVISLMTRQARSEL